MLEIRIHGRGGLGVVTLSELLGKTALKAGMQAQTMPFFGVERRGADVKASVRLSDGKIKQRSQLYAPDYLTLMHANMFATAMQDGPHESATIIVNSSLPLETPHPQWFFDGISIAVKNNLIVGGEPFINVPMLGAMCRVLNLPKDLMEETIKAHWAGDKAAPNLLAASEAYDTVQYIEGGGAS